MKVTGTDTANAHVNYYHMFSNIVAVENTTAIDNLDAIHNWWGSCFGPTHTTNPTGKGDQITATSALILGMIRASCSMTLTGMES